MRELDKARKKNSAKFPEQNFWQILKKIAERLLWEAVNDLKVGIVVEIQGGSQDLCDIEISSRDSFWNSLSWKETFQGFFRNSSNLVIRKFFEVLFQKLIKGSL